MHVQDVWMMESLESWGSSGVTCRARFFHLEEIRRGGKEEGAQLARRKRNRQGRKKGEEDETVYVGLVESLSQ